LENNTTWDLVSDIEKLRLHLNVDRWLLFGGSWGSALALTYAIQHPKSVQGLILRGIFLCRPQEIHWFYQSGAHHIFPDYWEDYIAPIPFEERGNLLEAFYKRLTGESSKQRGMATKAWAMWEGRTTKLHSNLNLLDSTSIQAAYSLARIECHYFIHNAFFDSDNWILTHVHKLRHLPCTIIQGRYDMVCPMKSAWDLFRSWPEAKFEVIPEAGHSSLEPGTLDALIRATDDFLPHHKQVHDPKNDS
jgi:proline iminopeptidase